jgi:hypothetical protein
MIARIWRGAVRQADGDAYSRYMGEAGIAGYEKKTKGTRGQKGSSLFPDLTTNC